MTRIDELPEAYIADAGNHVVEPTWRLLADGFYGGSDYASRYNEGSILTMNIVPNHHLEPLNRAAGIAMARWLGTLPAGSDGIINDDLIEAAQSLAQTENLKDMTKAKYGELLLRTAQDIATRRRGGLAPGMVTDPMVNRPNATGVPAMLGVAVENARGPQFGSQRERPQQQQRDPRRPQERKPPAGTNMPPQGIAPV